MTTPNGFTKLFDSVYWHCLERVDGDPPTHDAPDGSLCTIKGFPNGDLYLRRNGAWVRLGGVADVIVVPTVAAVRIFGNTGFHPAIICQTHGGGVDGLTPRYDDGGSRLFHWDPTDTVVHSPTEDNGGTKLVTASGRLYVANASRDVPITWFGAYGDAKSCVDASITAGTNTLTSPTAVFKLGQTVLLPKTKFYPISGLCQTFNGSRGVWGDTSARYEDELWEGAEVTFAGHAGTFTVTNEMSGTVEYRSTDANWVGTGTQWLTEMHGGGIYHVRAGSNLVNASIHPLAFCRYTLSISDDTHAVVNQQAPDDQSTDATKKIPHVSGAKMLWRMRGDSNVTYTFTGTRTGTFIAGESATQAVSGMFGYVIGSTSTTLTVRYYGTRAFTTTNVLTGANSGATFTPTSFTVVQEAAQSRLLVKPAPTFSASGLQMFGPPQTLVATITAVSGDGHTATLSANADVTVTNGLCAYGTDNTAAWNATIANCDSVLVPANPGGAQPVPTSRFDMPLGSFLYAGDVEVPITRQHVEVKFSAGPAFVMGGSFQANGNAGDIYGQVQGWNGGLGFQRSAQVQFAYFGPYGKRIVYARSVGTGLRYLSARQYVDYTLDDNDTAFGGTGGVRGFEFSDRDVSGSAGWDVAHCEKLVAFECYDGYLINGGTQSAHWSDLWAMRYNNGWYPRYKVTGTRTGTLTAGGPLNGGELVTHTNGATAIVWSVTATELQIDAVDPSATGDFTTASGTWTGAAGSFAVTAIEYLTGPFSMGIGVANGASVHYGVPGAVNTASAYHGGGAIQGFRTGVQFGNPYFSQVATIDWIGMHSIIENMPPIDSAYMRMYGTDFTDVSGVHAENGPSADDFTNVGVELGSPSPFSRNFGFKMHGMVLTGCTYAVAAYYWDSFTIGPNELDASATYSQNANNKAKAFADLSGGAGGLRRHGVWLGVEVPDGGVNHDTLEIWPYGGTATDSATSGVIRYFAYNNDEQGIDRLESYQAGHSIFDEATPRILSGRGDQEIKGSGVKRWFENNFVGDADNNKRTTVNADSLAGTNILFVANATTGNPGFFKSALLEINLGGPRDELVIVKSIINSQTIELVAPLINTHTAADADVVQFAPSFLHGQGGFTWELQDGGGLATIYADQGGILLTNHYNADAVTVDRHNSFDLFSSTWDAQHSVAVQLTSIYSTRTISHNPLSTAIGVTYRGNSIWEGDDAWQFWIGQKPFGIAVLYGTGTPEGARAAPPGSLFGRQDPTPGAYVKESGTSTTGWAGLLSTTTGVPVTRTLTGTSPIRIDGVSGTPEDFSANRTISIDLSGIVQTTRQVIAGAGLTGGGALTSDVTLDAVANADGSIVVNANDIQVGVLATDAQHGARGGGTQHSAVSNAAAGFAPAITGASLVLTSNGGGTAATWQSVSGSGGVPSTRTLTGTAPITIDGVNTPEDLSANRTIAVSNATTGAVGVVQLAGDLNGTGTSATAPFVGGLHGVSNVVAMHGTSIVSDTTLALTIKGADDATAGGTAQSITIQAPNETGTGTTTGGGLIFQTGTGATAGKQLFKIGSTTEMNLSANGLRIGDSASALDTLEVKGNLAFDAGSVCIIYQPVATAGNGKTLLGLAQHGFQTGDTNGGKWVLQGGKNHGAGLNGGVELQLGSNANDIMLQIAEVTAGRRVVGICTALSLSTSDMPAGTGSNVGFWCDASAAPTADCTGGVIVYSDSAKFKVRGQNAFTKTLTAHGAPSPITSSYSDNIYGSATTTDAVTPATLLDIDVASLYGSGTQVITVTVTAMAVETGTGSAVSFQKIWTGTLFGGNLTAYGSISAVNGSSSAITTITTENLTLSILPSTTRLQALVGGAASITYNWMGKAEIEVGHV